jgi:hypothetical protein
VEGVSYGLPPKVLKPSPDMIQLPQSRLDHEGNRAFIARSPDNYVAILDLKTLEATGHLNVGAEPDGLAWAVRPSACGPST